MLRKVFILMVVLVFCSVCELQAGVINSIWVGGQEGYWSDANNWDPNIVPDNNDLNTFVVNIDSNSIGADSIEILLQQDRTVDEMDCYNNVELETWSGEWAELILENPQGLTNYGYLEIEHLTIDGNVTNTANAHLELETGGVEIIGNLTNAAGGQIDVKGTVDMVDGNFHNTGKIIIYGDGKILAWKENRKVTNNGMIKIRGGVCAGFDEFLNDSNGLVVGSGVVHSKQVLENKGTVYAYTGTLLVDSYGSLINTGNIINHTGSTLDLYTLEEDVSNQGTITINPAGAVTFWNDITNDPNGTIKLLGGAFSAPTITQSIEASFEGFGTIKGDFFIDPNGIIRLTGPTNIVGDVNIPANATLEISDGQTLITGLTTCDGTIHLIGGTVVFQGGCDCTNCNIINEAGIDRNHFDINYDGIEDFKDFAYFADTWLWQASWY